MMLALDGQGQARPRRRGQHKRSAEEQACVDAFAAFLRCDAPGAGRCLSRVGTTVLAGRLLPAARALADAIGIVLADELRAAAVGAGAWPAPAAGPIEAERTIRVDFTVSPACLLGVCRTDSGACSSRMCEHDCHGGSPAARPL
ncbi:MAG TPA: hypothetical protein VFV41_05380 [Streptosporangiaceae bacterium]|nr:hypothetical protein [Streptosporangiaceae bacterium]